MTWKINPEKFFKHKPNQFFNEGGQPFDFTKLIAIISAFIFSTLTPKILARISGIKSRSFLTMSSFFCYTMNIVNPSIGFLQEAYTNLGKEKDYVF